MEKLYAVKEDPRYDVILLDTPPTSHALDFLDAPKRLVDAIDSPAVRWFLEAFQQSGRLSFNLLQRTASSILRGIGRITGGGFLEQVATFMTEINELFGGWKQRAEVVASALRGDDVAYVLVTSPDPMSLREVRFFSERLASQGVRPAAYVVNRVRHVATASAGPATRDEVAAELARHSLDLGDDGPERVLEAARVEQRWGELDRLHLAALEGANDALTPILRVPDFPGDIHDIGKLVWVADALVGSTSVTS